MNDSTPSHQERADSEQPYLRRIELLEAGALSKCEFDLGKALVRHGAENLKSNPFHFDQQDLITDSGVAALIEAALPDLWRDWRDILRGLQSISRHEINAIRELRDLPPL